MLLEKAQEKLLKKSHLGAAMDTVGLKHVTRDRVDHLCLKIRTFWPRTRREMPSKKAVKRSQSADAPETQEQKKSKAGGAVDDALSNALVVDGESEAKGQGVESSVADAAPRHMQAKASVSSGEGGSAATAALSGEREERIRDTRSVTRDYYSSVTLEYGDVDQTIWAHLEFEDGQIVPLKNSISTSFYIGRESSNEHHHQFLHQVDNVRLRVSGKHCHILRLDAGSFSSCISRLTRLLLILMKYVN